MNENQGTKNPSAGVKIQTTLAAQQRRQETKGSEKRDKTLQSVQRFID